MSYQPTLASEVSLPLPADEREAWELEWVRLHGFLRAAGYELRARYQPDWVPSWSKLKKGPVLKGKYEDGVLPIRYNVMDAVRTRDNMAVFMKVIEPNDASEQHAQYFAEDPRSSDPRNHCCPVLDVLRPPERPGRAIIIMPRYLPWNVWPFMRVAEAVDFFAQVFEGLHFMHAHHFAHLDIGTRNVMMDGLHLCKEPCHPAEPQRALNGLYSPSHLARYQSPRPLRYYFIDFDLSVRFDSFEDRRALVRPVGADRTVPEERDENPAPYDPFAVDVYCLGNLIREHWFKAYTNVDFMRPLVDAMVQDDPASRPTAARVVELFEGIRASLTSKQLKCSLHRNTEYFTERQLVRRALAAQNRARKERAKQLAAAQGRPYGFVQHALYLFKGRPRSSTAAQSVSRDRTVTDSVSTTLQGSPQY